MNQEELIRRIKEKNIEEEIIFNKGGQYFKSAQKYYADLQDGTASPENFFENTLVRYEECDKPNRKPDFESYSGSRYWYTKKGVVRGSDHWGCGIVNCDWALHTKDGRNVYGGYWTHARSFAKPKYGFAEWKDFLFKARLVEIDGKELVTSFSNCKGRDLIEIDGKRYQRRLIEVFEEIEEE